MTPVVDIRGLTYRYADGRRALDNVTLSVAARERVALVGPNGAGKSTLLLHLPGLLPEPIAKDGSAVTIEGLPIIASNLRHIRSAVGLVFQDPDDQLFCPTVLDDVAFGPLHSGAPPAAAVASARGALREVGLGPEFERRSPSRLSDGEKKRVALAGVLAMSPSLLALDEPTGHLDPRSRRQLIAALVQVTGAMIIATHDLELALELCPRAVILDQGKVVATGATVELLQHRELMERHGLEVPLSLRLKHH